MRNYLTKFFIFLRVIALLYFATACETETIILSGYIVELDKSILPDELASIQDYEQQNEIVSALLLEEFSKIVPPKYITAIYSEAILGFAAQLSRDMVECLKRFPYVKEVEPMDKGCIESKNAASPWNIQMIGSMDCRNKQGSKNAIFVLDSGIAKDLKLNVDWKRSKSFVQCGNGEDVDDYGISKNFVGDGSGEDENGHGSSVADIANMVAKGALFVSCRVTGPDGKGNIGELIAAIDWIARGVGKKGDIVNICLGGPYFKTFHNAVSYAVKEKGLYVVMAAGNDGKNLANFPRLSSIDMEGVYVIASLDKNYKIADNSNYATYCWATPGSNILCRDLKGCYVYKSGTSMAAPHFTGITWLNGDLPVAKGTISHEGTTMKLPMPSNTDG